MISGSTSSKRWAIRVRDGEEKEPDQPPFAFSEPKCAIIFNGAMPPVFGAREGVIRYQQYLSK